MILKVVHNRDEFCRLSEPALGVFGSKGWLAVYGDTITIVGIYKDELQLIGGFYFLNTKKYGFNFLKLPPYTPHCGLFFHSESKNKSSYLNFSKEVISEVCSYFSKISSALTILAFPSNIIDLQPFIWGKYKVVPNYTYRIDLRNPLETIKSNFDPKTRNVINKATKDGVDVYESKVKGNELFTFFKNTLISAGANVYEDFLRKIFLEFSTPSNSFSVQAFKNQQLVGAVFCVYDKTSCYYLLGGVDKAAGIQGINALLVSKSIEKATELGCTIFDFEGSMLKGVEKFFRGFGAELVPFYTANKAKLPIEILLKFKKRELF